MSDCCAVVGVALLGIAGVIYTWLPKAERNLNADKRRRDLLTGQNPETGRSLSCRNGWRWPPDANGIETHASMPRSRYLHKQHDRWRRKH